MKLIQNAGLNPALVQALTDLDVLKLLMLAEPSFTEETASAWACLYFSDRAEELGQRYTILSELRGTDAVRTAYRRVIAFREERDKLSRAVSKLNETLYRVRVLKSYTAMIQALQAVLPDSVSSARLKELRTLLKVITESKEYAAILSGLEDCEKILAFPRTVDVGINTREDGEAVEMSILEDAPTAAPLEPLIAEHAPNGPSHSLFDSIRYTREQYGLHFEEYLQHHLEKHYHSELQKIGKRIQHLLPLRPEEFLELEDCLHFCEIALTMRDLFTERGYALCRPDATAFSLHAEGLVYPDLALHLDQLEGKEVRLATGSSTLITGANHSGKTSYLKTIGQSVVLAQLGFSVPAASFSFRPFRNLYSLFSAGEDSSMSVSRMGVEIQKLTKILNDSRSSDLVLINEPMTSTNPVEAVSICAELMEHFLKKDITHLVVTHLYDIYYLLQSRLSDADRKRMYSLITESIFDPERGMIHSYRLRLSPPRGNSYAMETAKQFGITLEDLLHDPALIREAYDYCQSEDPETLYEGGANHGISD